MTEKHPPVEGGRAGEHILLRVHWDPSQSETELTGEITVAEPFAAPYDLFSLAGVRFAINGLTVGRQTARFSYAGHQGVTTIKHLFTAGALLRFSEG